MSNERTEQLIVELTTGLSPVRRLPAIPARIAGWLAPAAGSAALMAWAIGPRADVVAALAHPDVVWSLLLAAVTAVAAALGALRLSVPGAGGSRWARWFPIGVVAAWALILPPLAHMFDAASRFTGEAFHPVCMLRVIAIALVPVALLARSTWRGFALDRGWAAALAALGGGAIGAFAVQLVCPIDAPAHVLVSHAAPMLALMALGAVTPSVLPARASR